MLSHIMKMQIINKPMSSFKRLFVGVLFLTILICISVIAQAANFATESKAGQSGDLITKIDDAIQEVEKRLGNNPMEKEVRQTITKPKVDRLKSKKTKMIFTTQAKTNLEPKLREVKPKPQKKFSLWPFSPTSNAKNQKTSDEIEKEKSERKAKQLVIQEKKDYQDTLIKDAKFAYQSTQDYSTAYELASDALRLDPNDKRAKELQLNIERDIDSNPVRSNSWLSRSTPPDGVLAYKVALSDGSLSLEEAIDVAKKSNLLIQETKKRVDGSKRKLFEAKRALFPTMSGEIKVNGGQLAGGAYSGESFKLNASQPLYYGGELIITIKQAEANLKSDIYKYEQEISNAAGSAAQAYNQVVSSEHNLKYQEALFKDLTEYMNTANKAYEQKLIAEIDHLELTSILDQAEFQFISAQTQLEAAKLTLEQAMGVQLETSLAIDLGLEFNKPEVELKDFLSMVMNNNMEIKIKESTAKVAYYGLKVFDAKRKPRVDLRGSLGLAGEVAVDHATSPDLEDEKFIAIEVTMPWEANTLNYSYRRRFFGPTISSFLGSEDWQHSWTMNLLDKLADATDEDIAKADYLKAKAEYESEKITQEIAARQAYYELKNAVLQIKTAETKIKFRSKRLLILKHTTGMEEAKLSELLNEKVSFAEESYAKITSLISAKDAINNMNGLIGIEGYYGFERN
ncbi:MAG: outer membrane protein TolC [Candidatus Omnitrophota bacterium]|jgi:outer membrane protein TolC